MNWLTRLRPPFSFSPLILSMGAGLLVGVVFAIRSEQSSPYTSVFLLLGLGVAVAVFISPYVGFLLTAAMVPLERFGRFTNDDSTFTFSVMRMAGFLSVGAFLLFWLLTKRKLRAPSSFLFYAAYMSLGVLSLSWSSDLHYGFNQTSMQLGNLMFFFVVLNIVENLRKARLALAVWLMVTVVIGVYTIHQWYSTETGLVQTQDFYLEGASLTTTDRFAAVIYDVPTRNTAEQKRAIGTTSHPGGYGINLLLSMPLFIYFYRTVSIRWLKGIIAAGGAITAYNIMLTNTRAVLLTFVVLILISLAIGLLRLKPWLVLACVSAGAVALYAAPEDLKGRIFHFDNWFSERRDSSFGDRLYLMQVSIDLISENPIFGIGLGNQVDVPKRAKLDWRDHARSAHNDFIATLLEVGIVGLVLVVAFLVSLYRRLRFCERVGLAQKDLRLHLLMNAARVQLLCVLFFGLQAEPLTLPIKGFWLTAGIVVALSETLIERAKVIEATLPVGVLAQT